MKSKITLEYAELIASRLIARLEPACERIEVAGSIRRKKAEVGDIEIVAISKSVEIKDLFGTVVERRSLLGREVDNLIDATPQLNYGGINGDKAKRLTFSPQNGKHIGIDLFITTPEQWGLIYAIRTGPADFSRWFVTQAAQGGPLPPGYRVAGGHLLNGNETVPTPEERDLFTAAGIEWIEPEQRNNRELWKKAA